MPNEPQIYRFLLGTLVMASAVAGLLFLRFWRRTHDRLLLAFALAFWLLGLNWLVLEFISWDEMASAVYLIRAFAFILIIAAIVDKNRAKA